MPQEESNKNTANTRYTLITIGAVLGFAIGYTYWYFWSCDHGCAITSVWWKTSIFGAIFGGLIFDIISDILSKRKLG